MSVEASITQYESAINKKKSLIEEYKKTLSGDEQCIFTKDYIIRRTEELNELMQAFDHALQKFGRIKDVPKPELMAAQISKYQRGIKTVEDSIRDYQKAIDSANKIISKNQSLKIDAEQFKNDFASKVVNLHKIAKIDKKYYKQVLIFKLSPLYTKKIIRKSSSIYYNYLETMFKQNIHEIKLQIQNIPSLPQINFITFKNCLYKQMLEYPEHVENNCKKVEKQLHKVSKRISMICLKSPPSVTEILATTHNSDMKIAYAECKFKKEKMKIIEIKSKGFGIRT